DLKEAHIGSVENPLCTQLGYVAAVNLRESTVTLPRVIAVVRQPIGPQWLCSNIGGSYINSGCNCRIRAVSSGRRDPNGRSGAAEYGAHTHESQPRTHPLVTLFRSAYGNFAQRSAVVSLIINQMNGNTARRLRDLNFLIQFHCAGWIYSEQRNITHVCAARVVSTCYQLAGEEHADGSRKFQATCDIGALEWPPYDTGIRHRGQLPSHAHGKPVCIHGVHFPRL